MMLMAGVVIVEGIFFSAAAFILNVDDSASARSQPTSSVVNAADPAPRVQNTSLAAEQDQRKVPDTVAEPSTDDSRSKQDVIDHLNSWKSRAESLDLDSYMNHYAQTIDYYGNSRASLAEARKDKLRAFSRYTSISITLSKIQIGIDASGNEAKVTLDKEWDFRGNGSSSGKIQQLIRLRRSDSRWLITAEKELILYYKK